MNVRDYEELEQRWKVGGLVALVLLAFAAAAWTISAGYGPTAALAILGVVGVAAISLAPASRRRADAPTELTWDKTVDGTDEIWHFGGLDLRLSPHHLAYDGGLRRLTIPVHEITTVFAMTGQIWASTTDGRSIELGDYGVSDDAAEEGAADLLEGIERRRRGDADDLRAMRDQLSAAVPEDV